jgi:hypothetical protein
MKKVIITILALTGLSARAQLIVTNQATSGVAFTMQSDSALLNYAETSAPAFISAGLEFTLIPNYPTGGIIVGNGIDGSFFANVSFLARESLRPNHFGVSTSSLDGFGSGGTTLFFDYSDDDLPVTKNVSSLTYQELNFWHYAAKIGFDGTFFMDDGLSFRTWEAVDVDNNRIYTMFGIDDLRSNFIDFNDGVFLVERNLLPINSDDPSPVPEPSTYGAFAALALLGLIAMRKSRKLSA